MGRFVAVGVLSRGMPDSYSRAAAARELVAARTFGVLVTNSARRPGFPFGSVTIYAADDRGRPVFLLSALAVHSKNLAADTRASLVVFDEKTERDPLASPRLNLIGNVLAIPDSEREVAHRIYLGRHPESSAYVGFGDFAFYRMEVMDIYYVAGFGEMGWISVPEYERSV